MIADDLEISWRAISRTVELRGKAPDDLDEFRQNFCLPYWNYLEGKRLSSEQAKDMSVVKTYITFYRDRLDRIRLFEDVEVILSFLKDRGLKIAVVSHSPRDVVTRVVDKYNLWRFFSEEAVFTLEDFREQKPNPESILLALEEFEMAPSQALYVGDMREDIVAARRAGVTSVAISRDGSYHTEEILRKEEPNHLLRTLKDIRRIVD